MRPLTIRDLSGRTKKVKWIRCPLCRDWWCLLHEAHVWECSCPDPDSIPDLVWEE